MGEEQTKEVKWLEISIIIRLQTVILLSKNSLSDFKG